MVELKMSGSSSARKSAGEGFHKEVEKKVQFKTNI